MVESLQAARCPYPCGPSSMLSLPEQLDGEGDEVGDEVIVVDSELSHFNSTVTVPVGVTPLYLAAMCLDFDIGFYSLTMVRFVQIARFCLFPVLPRLFVFKPFERAIRLHSVVGWWMLVVTCPALQMVECGDIWIVRC